MLVAHAPLKLRDRATDAVDRLAETTLASLRRACPEAWPETRAREALPPPLREAALATTGGGDAGRGGGGGASAAASATAPRGAVRARDASAGSEAGNTFG